MIKRDQKRRDEARRRLFRRRFRIIPRVRAYFLAGILVIMPLAVTFLVVWWFIGVVDNYVVPWIPDGCNPDHYLKETVGLEVGLPDLGLVVLLVVITLIDALTAGFLGRMVLNIGERILARMPVIRSVYSAIKKFLETVLQQQSKAFRQAV